MEGPESATVLELRRKLSELQKYANRLEENQFLLKEELRKKTFSAAIIGERSDDFHFYTSLANRILANL